MAPRVLSPKRPSSIRSLDCAQVIGEDGEVDAAASQLEPIALQVFHGRRRILEMVLDMGTTVTDLKLQVETVTGIPAVCQIITSNGRPLCSSMALQTCLKHIISSVTVREAEESWVRALEELSESRATKLSATLQTRCDSALKEGLLQMEQLRQKSSSTVAHYKEATLKLLSSASVLKDAAERLHRNRAVVFEAAPRGSKGARRVAEELLHCRSALLSATRANGLVLSDRSGSITAELLEVRGALRRAKELLLQRCELLHWEKFSGCLGDAEVERHLQQCREELASLETADLENACQELVAARSNYKVAMKANLLAIKRASEYLQQDERVVLSWALNHVSKGRALDRDFMLTVVQSNGEALEEAAPELQHDREVVLEALRSSKGWALQFAADELKRDPQIVLTAVRRSGLCLQFAAAEMRADRDVVLAAVHVDGEALEFASAELRRDAEVVAAAIQTSCGWALQHASEELRSDRDVVLAALPKNGLMLEHVSSQLQGDAEVALVAVTANPSALQFASEELRNTRKVVLAAVSRDGFALRFASSPMKADREVVAAAVNQAGDDVLVIADQSMSSDAHIAELAQKFGTSHVDTASSVSELVEDSWSDTAHTAHL